LKFHDHEVGVPADVSVNCTDCPAAGDAGLKLNDAANAATTVTVRVVLFDPDPFVTVSVTVFAPAVVNVCVGFWAVDAPPSPKFHDHEVGVPADVSVNCTDCPAAGDAGLKLNDAVRTGAFVTVTILLPFLAPEVVSTAKDTV